MPLHIDYRPKSFEEIYGNYATITSLQSVYSREQDYPHAVLLQGSKGCGKTTISRIIVEKLGCKGSDLVQIDGGDVKADVVRQIKEQSRYKPIMSKRRVWIIEEAHMIGVGGGSEKNIPQNNFLTLLEEPPKHVYFILCTTDPQRLVETIRSRCHTFEVGNLNKKDCLALLNDILKKEEINDVPPIILEKIFEASEGCPRDALKILDQIIDMPADQMESGIQSFFYGESQVKQLIDALMRKESWNRLRLIIKNLDLSNPENARRAVIGYMSSVILGGDNATAALIYDAFKESRTYTNGKAGFVFQCYEACVNLND